MPNNFIRQIKLQTPKQSQIRFAKVSVGGIIKNVPRIKIGSAKFRGIKIKPVKLSAKMSNVKMPKIKRIKIV